MKVLLALALAALAAAVCPPNTFTCNDGSCIPEDWVQDGEPDCEDRSDELNNQTNPREDDPFDEIVTLATAPPPVRTPAQNPQNATEECPYEHQLRIDECSENILMFIQDVNAIYFENSSFLADRSMQQKIEKGCDLLHEYEICVEGASRACNPDEGVRSWMDIEMYACQLLIPAVREHDQCFSRGRHQECTVRFDPIASPFCRLVTSVTQDVECLQRLPNTCSESAMEMLPPILEESEHTAEALRCRKPSAVPSTTEEPPVQEVPEAPTTRETPIPPRPPTTQVQFEEDSDITSMLPEEPTTFQRTESTRPPTVAVEGETEAPTKRLVVNMSDAVNALYYIYDICSSDFSKSPFSSVAEKLCEKQDEIAKYSDCYQATLEKMKCAAREAKNECQALDAFNANLDCAIVTMNDACEVDAQNLVIDIQEAVNDVIIEKKCFNVEETKEAENKTEGEPEFKLESTLPKCTEEQENGALGCLVELVEINKQLAQFQNLNFLLEIASPNSTVVESICGLFSRYEMCLSTSVFKNGQRCSFASPLNTLARIGLAPICSLDSRPLLASHRPCLLKLAEQSSPETNCQSGLSNLGNTVNMMLQGIHGEALLCKSFYLLRETFACGERAVQRTCDSQALEDLSKLKSKMTALGQEEGCPSTPPENLDEIIARPVQKPQPVVVPQAPQARPMAPPPPPPPTPSAGRPVQGMCAPDHQKKFEECVRPLTSYQPHPLSVIKMPRQIDEACVEFKKFRECVAEINCHPLWAKGMTAMFEFACGEGSEGYKKVRQCIRRVSGEEIIRDCVATFSRGAPTQACLSANKLLSCALGTIQTECGTEGADWVSAYVTKFATAIDSRCKLSSQLPIGKVIGVGCTADEEAIIEHCAAPLNDIGSRMEELFQGGLQSMIKNVNSLAPVFAGGCNLTDEFRTCASFLLSGRSPCVVSSCMIQAGDGICDKPDPAKAIDENLSCVFGQVQEPTFAKCVRSTLTTVKQFTLASFRNVLPKFIDCTEEIVRAKCGEIPINVLRAMSSPDVCPVTSAPAIRVPTQVVPQPNVCTPEKKQSYDQCTQPFYAKYRMLPMALLNEIDNMEQVCTDVATMDGCSISTRICSTPQQMALKKLVLALCNSRSTFEQHKICLKTVATGPIGSSCMSEFLTASPTDGCAALKNAAKCMSEQVQEQCGDDALAFSYSVMSDYAASINPKCSITPPSVDLETGCSEDDMIEFLGCESTLDRFSFRPVSIIGNASQFDEFCSVFNEQYRPCIEKMKCRFEPASSSNIKLMDEICNKPVTKKQQIRYGPCLSEYTVSKIGSQCIQKMADVDPLGKDAPRRMCSVLNDILQCAAHDVEEKCSYDALLHVYDLHIQWATGYNTSCVIQSPEPKSVPSNTLDESRDAAPVTVVQDDTTPAASTTMESTSTTTTTETTTTTHPKDITTVKACSLATIASMAVALLSMYIL